MRAKLHRAIYFDVVFYRLKPLALSKRFIYVKIFVKHSTISFYWDDFCFYGRSKVLSCSSLRCHIGSISKGFCLSRREANENSSEPFFLMAQVVILTRQKIRYLKAILLLKDKIGSGKKSC